jgi:hypothetical protein
MKIGQRPGDAAPMVLLELIPDENSKAETKPAPKGKETKEPAEPKAKGKTKEAAPAEPKAKSKAKAGAAPKVKKDAGARAPAKSAATMKRSGRSSGGK